MSIRVPTHLYRNRHGTFYFRLSVPLAHQAAVGRTEIRLSLQTEDKSVAIIAALSLIADQKRLWSEVRSMSDQGNPLAEDYFQKWRTVLLENDRLRLQNERLEERLRALEQQLAATVPRERAQLVVKSAYKQGQLRGRVELEENLVFPWPAEKTQRWSALLGAYMNHFSYRAANGRKRPPSAKTLEGYRKDLETFLQVMGDMHIGAIDRDVAGTYFNTLRQLPANMSRVARFRGKSVAEILAMKPEPQSEYNASKKMERASGMFKWALEEKRKWGIDANPFAGFGQDGSSSRVRRPFTSDELRRLLEGSVYANRMFPQSYMYWLIPMAVYTGARLGELCQLDLKDFVEVEGIQCIDINDIEAPEVETGAGAHKKSVKTKNARRLVPIHSELVRLGLLRYVELMRRKGAVHLFPELSRTRRDGPAHAPSNWFQRYRKKSGISGKNEVVFHSFRHLFITTLLDGGVSPHLVAPIVGHEADLITAQVYWNKRDASKRKPTVDAFRLPDDIAAMFPALEDVRFQKRRTSVRVSASRWAKEPR